MSRNRRNGYEENTPSFTRGSRGRAQNFRNASYDDYDDEDYTGYGNYKNDYNSDNFADEDYSSYEQDDNLDNYEDEDTSSYDEYGEFGSGVDDPNYGYDNYDGYEEYEDRTYAPSSRTPRSGGYRSNRANDYVNDVLSSSPAERRNRFGNGRANNDLSKYLEALEKYDRGDINNYEMSKIQRKYANNPFWRTFRPSRDLIKKYGSGNKSTRWPMFKNEGGQWKAEIWRND